MDEKSERCSIGRRLFRTFWSEGFEPCRTKKTELIYISPYILLGCTLDVVYSSCNIFVVVM